MRTSSNHHVPDLVELTGTGALSRHLADRLQVGDVVLTGADDPVSWIIQTGSRSPYSHVGLVTGPGHLIEAYDYALTPDESDEGVFAISLDEFLGRGNRLRAVEVRRPDRLDQQRLLAAADHLERHSPGFPTLGMAGLAICGLTGPVLRRLPESARRRVANRQTALAGDGVRCLHCAETVTRLYHAAGLEVRFRSPRLWDHLLDLLRNRPGLGLAALPTGRRRADRGHWPTGSMKATGFALSSTLVALRQRRRHQPDDTVDAADLILPGDFARAEPFTTVERFRRRGNRWVAVSPSIARLDQPKAWSTAEADNGVGLGLDVDPTPDLDADADLAADLDADREAESWALADGSGRLVTGSRPASLSR